MRLDEDDRILMKGHRTAHTPLQFKLCIDNLFLKAMLGKVLYLNRKVKHKYLAVKHSACHPVFHTQIPQSIFFSFEKEYWIYFECDQGKCRF